MTTTLVATWSDGLLILDGDDRTRVFRGRCVGELTSDGRGGALAIVDGHALHRRDADGVWTELATSEHQLACAVAAPDAIFVGTNGDARLLRVSDDGDLEPVAGFDVAEGRDGWYAGSVEINGQVVGPPLGVRSLTATAGGAAVLANIHVGGIPRSTDGGATWRSTIEVDHDVHEVVAHPTRPEVVIAAAAVGLCVSTDGGATWAVETEGLHATYGSAAAFSGDDLLIAASSDHFAAEGAVYRRPLAVLGPLTRCGPADWLAGIVDTGCLAARGGTIAMADQGGHLYQSEDAGATWECRADDLPSPSRVLLL